MSPAVDGELAAPKPPKDFSEGYLVIRPEFLRFLDRKQDAQNAVRGQLYNEYALGSRIQYQIRAGEQVFVVEKLRQQAYAGQRDDEVLIGWDAKDDVILVRRVDGADGRNRRSAGGAVRLERQADSDCRRALHALPVSCCWRSALLRRSSPSSATSFMPPRTFDVSAPSDSQNYVDDFREHQLYFLSVVAGPGGIHHGRVWR